jgi:hypothetical protein
MTDRAQFEAMLEALINDDQAQAKEIFHNIVVGKSREIYEELLAEDFSQDTGNPYKKESSEEEEMPMEEDDEMSPMEASDEEDDEMDMDSEEDDADAEEDDGEENPFDDEESDEEGDEDLEDRVMDLEDALEDLKAEFEQLLADEGEEDSMDMGADDIGGDMGGMDMDAEVDELASLMEYVDKVAPPKMGDNGAYTRATVASKNDMGGTTGNMTKSFSTEKGGTQGGLLKPTTAAQDGGNVNVPGAKNATKLSPVKGGHGAEKKGSSETAPDKKSLIGSRK